jgi:molybdenum cofactor biosynthesis enzyme MoaA
MKLEKIGFYTLTDKRAKNLKYDCNIERAEVILNNKCNFDCVYCKDKKGNYEISIRKAKKIIDLLADRNVKNIRFSGGEPTLYPFLLDLIQRVKKIKSIEHIAVSTNGSADLNFYIKLYEAGVNDFSISLDSCCSDIFNIMSSTGNYYDKVIRNIKILSKLTYVSIGMVINENNNRNYTESYFSINHKKSSVINKNTVIDTINFLYDFNISDIRVIPAVQYGKFLKDFNIEKKILKKFPILNYRYNRMKKKLPIRGLNKNNSKKCFLVLDDILIKNDYHYPCPIYYRESGPPIGKINDDIKKDRYEWFLKTNTHNDNICKNNCLDICKEHNNKKRSLYGKRF